MSNEKAPLIPYSAIYLDINWSFMLQALTQFIYPADRKLLESLIVRTIIRAPSKGFEQFMITASVRTSFDLILQVLNLPVGSEMVMTAVNIPDMIKIVRHHGIIPVPVDLSLEDIGPSFEDFKKAFTPKTKIVMISFLYGAKFEAEKFYEYARQQNCFIIEDQAESFSGVNDIGSWSADCTLFSFGTIKPFTAYGGCITIMRNNESMYEQMRQILSTYEMMPNSFFLKKILKNTVVYSALNIPYWNQLVRHAFTALKYDYKSKFVSMVRGFQPKDSYLHTYRLQIPTPMMALLYFQLRDYNHVSYQMQVKKLTKAQTDLTNGGVVVPGRACQNRSFWLYPIITKNPKLVFEILNARGVDAYLGATQLDLVESPIGYNYAYPTKTRDFFKNIIYLPLHRNVPEDQVNKIVQETIQVVRMVEAKETQKQTTKPSL